MQQVHRPEITPAQRGLIQGSMEAITSLKETAAFIFQVNTGIYWKLNHQPLTPVRPDQSSLQATAVKTDVQL